jgi:DNA-directed RNA polymerase specialized sigma24 family protein
MSHLPDPRDIAELFQRLAAREKAAFGEIAMRLRDQLRRFARLRLKRNPELSAIYDEDDAMQSGLGVMWNGILTGTLAPPDGIGSFLRVARTIVGRRITAKARAERAAKRDPTANAPPDWRTGPFYWLVPDSVDLFQIGVPSDEAKAIAKNTTFWLLELLGPALRGVAEDRFLNGMAVAAIAAKHETPLRTVERMIQDIRTIWHDEARRLDR